MSTALDGPTDAELPPAPTRPPGTLLAPRIAVLGDSIIFGLGVPKPQTYPMLVAEQLGASAVLDLSRSTCTIEETLAGWDQVLAFGPDLILLTVGGADALVHPARLLEALLDRAAPPSWRGVAGLEPRVVYSRSSRRRRIRQKITTGVKVTVKHIGIRLSGGYRRVEPDQFGALLVELGRKVTALDAPIVVLPPGQVDGRMFPRSNESLASYADVVSAAAATWPSALRHAPDYLQHWDDFAADRGHYSPAGHAKVAAGVVATLTQAGLVRRAG
jgi:lysophospholipase L1-like esterase